MMAQRLPSILPPLTLEESLETTKIHSVAGLLRAGSPLISERPFRSPHLKRAHRVFTETPVADKPADKELARLMHATVKKVTRDLDHFDFNTAISALMVYLNELAKLTELPREAAEKFVLMLAPFAPHLGEELWQTLGHTDTVTYEPWPKYDEKMLEVSEVEILVQLMGKPRVRLMLPVGCSAADAERIVLANADVRSVLAGKTVRKVIYVPGRLVNIVAN